MKALIDKIQLNILVEIGKLRDELQYFRDSVCFDLDGN